MNGSLAQLLDFWLNDIGKVDERELVILLLETIRDDISQAQTKNGRRVANPRDMQDYLNEQIAELRRLWEKTRTDAAD